MDPQKPQETRLQIKAQKLKKKKKMFFRDLSDLTITEPLKISGNPNVG